MVINAVLQDFFYIKQNAAMKAADHFFYAVMISGGK